MSLAMSSDDIEVLRDGFKALEEGGYEALLPLIAPDFEMTTPPGQAAEPDTYRGRDGMRRWWESFYEVMDDIEIRPRSFIDAGEGRVISEFTLGARGQASGIEVKQETVTLWTFRDQKAIRIEFFQSLDEAKEAATAHDAAVGGGGPREGDV
jgi:ketosteroid isomerase-like protein